jgi:isochorismate synthase
MSRLAMQTASVADPGDFLALAAAANRPFCYLESPSRRAAMLGVGIARIVETRGPDRFRAAESLCREAVADLAIKGRSPRAPRWIGGFGFADDPDGAREWREFPALRFVLPSLLWVRDAGGCWLAVAGRRQALADLEEQAERITALRSRTAPDERVTVEVADRGDDRAPFAARVEAAKQAICAGTFIKVVLARRREWITSRPLSPIALARAARALRPGCTTFVIAAGATSFVGSSPELLVRSNGRHAESVALAGSAPPGATLAEGARFAERLRRCAKNGREHALVVDAIRDALAPLGGEITGDHAPRILRLPEAQHLATRVRVELARETPLLQLAERLHPTPAVCGAPRAAAGRWIERDEPSRGWYAGGVGWIEAAGGAGEISVALRSAILDGRRGVAYAGAGIVAESDPELELAETEAKFGALIPLLGARDAAA